MGDDDMGLIENIEDAWVIDYEDLEFGDQLGEGAFGSVFRGSYFGTEVAIKRLFQEDDSPDTELFIQREINVLQGMRHPNIVQFIGIARHPEKGLHIVTELVTAGDLRKLLKNPKIKLSWPDRLKIAHSAACAMAYLHSRSIIHRDLKSKNLLVEDSWRVKICDFGFARTTIGKGARPMTLCGTDDWMAPEIILGSPYSQAADVFSFGIVLCEIITRKKISQELQRSPMDAFGLSVEKFKKIIPNDCPTEFSILAIECCAHEPDDRPTFPQVVRRLKALLKDVEDKEKAKSPAAGSESVEKFKAYADRLKAMKENKSSPAAVHPPVASKPSPQIAPAPARTSPATQPVSKPATTFAPKPAPAPVQVASTTNKRVASNKWGEAIEQEFKQPAAVPAKQAVPAKPAVATSPVQKAAPVVSSPSSGGGGGPFYSYDTLRNNAPPELDRNDLPKFLSEEEFKVVFNMTKAQFYAMPAWKQRGRKRELMLF